MQKIFIIAEKLRDNKNSISANEKTYLEQYLSAFKINIADFLIVLKELNYNVEVAFDKIKAVKKISEIKQYIRRKSCELHNSLDINSNYIHDMAS